MEKFPLLPIWCVPIAHDQRLIRRLRGVALVLLQLTLLSACGEPAPSDPVATKAQPTSETKSAYMATMRELGVDRYLGTQPASSTTHGDWTAYHYPLTTGAGCLYGTEFVTSVRKSRSGSSNVVLYLQGGGACWNETTCSVGFASKDARPASPSGGIFAEDNPENPVRDWNIVYADYCDGSVFSGDNITTYGDLEVYHWGLRNLSAAVTLMREQFPDPEQVLVTGASAGGFGTFMGFGVTRLAYPDAFLHVLNDSGPGFENPLLNESMGTEIRKRWKFEQFVPAACERCDEQLTYLVPYALANDPDMHAGLFSYLDDVVIGTLFVRYFEQYPYVLRETTDEIHAAYPDRFRRFLVDGWDHTIITGDQFYHTWPNGYSVARWMDGFLDDNLDEWPDLR